MEPYELYEDQRKAVDFILEHKAVLLKAPTGAGKTLVGVHGAMESDSKVVLCIVPINTFSSWQATVERQWPDHPPVHIITSKVAGKRAHGALLTGEPGIYIIGREYFRSFGWSKIKGKCDFIVLDECHVASNRNSKMFLVLKTAKAPYKLAMSATPWGNKVEGAWSLARWLWPHKTERGFWNWITEFFHTEKNPYVEDDPETGRPMANPTIMAERNPGAVWKSLPAAFRMKSVYKADPTIHYIDVEISREQRRIYNDLERDAIAWLDDHPLAVDLPPVLNMRLRQICLAVPSIKQDWVRKQDKDTGDWDKVWDDVVYFEDDARSSKVDAVLELLSDLHAERPEPVVIYTDSRHFATLMAKRLQTKGYRARQFIGGMSAAERTWKKDNFGVEFDVIVCTIPTVAEGLDGWQFVSNLEIWANVSYNPLLNTQAKGRLSRTGQKRTVQRYMIRAVNTVESKQHDRLKSSEDLMNASIEETEESA